MTLLPAVLRARARWSVLLLLAVTTLPVHGDPGGAAVRRALEEAVSRPAPAEVSAEAVDTLAFRRDPAVSAQVQRETIRALGRTPDQRAELEQAIGSGEMMRRFDAILRRYGYSPANLGDVLAAHLLISWEVANDRDSRASPAGQRAVRRQLIPPLAAVPEVAAMSDAAKQAQAERTAYLTMMSALSYQMLKREGSRAAQATLAADVRRSLQGSGVDLQRIELGDGGLVER